MGRSRANRGVGLASMSERAAELGGRCTVEAPPKGGTRIEVWLPLDAAREAET